jgi:hypothetical protein
MALAAILIWYMVIGVLAAIGSITISRGSRRGRSTSSSRCCPIAAMYLAWRATHLQSGGRSQVPAYGRGLIRIP